MKDRGHKLLWAPPYCPELQPIELFWEAWGNHVALHHNQDIKMKEVVHYLREGWYGNFDKFPDKHPFKKRAADCQKMWEKCLDFTRTKYVNLCEGISGTLPHLTIDQTVVDEQIDLPIDTLIVTLTNDDGNDEEMYLAANI